MKIDLVKEISLLTTISESALDKLTNKITWCISDGIEKCLYNGDSNLEIDLDIGTLIILIGEDNIKYKFIPKEQLEKAIVNTIIEGKNLLELTMEKTLVNKITNLYKDMF